MVPDAKSTQNQFFSLTGSYRFGFLFQKGVWVPLQSLNPQPQCSPVQMAHLCSTLCTPVPSDARFPRILPVRIPRSSRDLSVRTRQGAIRAPPRHVVPYKIQGFAQPRHFAPLPFCKGAFSQPRRLPPLPKWNVENPVHAGVLACQFSQDSPVRIPRRTSCYLWSVG